MLLNDSVRYSHRVAQPVRCRPAETLCPCSGSRLCIPSMAGGPSKAWLRHVRWLPHQLKKLTAREIIDKAQVRVLPGSGRVVAPELRPKDINWLRKEWAKEGNSVTMSLPLCSVC